MSILTLSIDDINSIKEVKEALKISFIRKELKPFKLLNPLATLYEISSKDIKDKIINDDIQKYIIDDNKILEKIKDNIVNEIQVHVIDKLYVSQILILYGLFEDSYNDTMTKILMDERNHKITLNYIKASSSKNNKLKLHRSLDFDAFSNFIKQIYDKDIFKLYLSEEDISNYKLFIKYRNNLAHTGKYTTENEYLDMKLIINFYLSCIKIIEVIFIYSNKQEEYKKDNIGDFIINYSVSGEYYLINNGVCNINKVIKEILLELKCSKDPLIENIVNHGISKDTDIRKILKYTEINGNTTLFDYFTILQEKLINLNKIKIYTNRKELCFLND